MKRWLSIHLAYCIICVAISLMFGYVAMLVSVLSFCVFGISLIVLSECKPTVRTWLLGDWN